MKQVRALHYAQRYMLELFFKFGNELHSLGRCLHLLAR